ncbi:ATP-dependent permease [Exophiala xenobiotica]|nr:ATP-dependent permease [Exophiala xenobiotica]KAK5383252.1 ATP-dependent permease [Exophiala xenobiotica]KAK5384535.1 ATP-dependent permease [Exophiala xenobiotica]KAK5424466.1 ATP-dependent permease [Exophiala xenobiotica]KAK5500365.1 ATP-dependent permease [Exophiala xenobiotica]
MQGSGAHFKRSIFAFTKASHLPVFIPGLLLSVAAGLLQPAMAIFFGKFFNAFSSYVSGDIDESTFVDRTSGSIYALLGIGASTLLLKGGVFIFWLNFGELQAQCIRKVLFESLLSRDIEWFDAQTTGMAALLARMHTQIQEVQLATSQPLGLSILAFVQALAALVLAFRTNWKLTLVVLSVVPVIIVGISFISRHGHRYISGHNEKLNQAMKLANNFITNIVLVKCFNTQDQEARKYAIAIEEAAQLSLKSSIFKALQSGFVRFASTVIFVQGFWYGGTQVHAGKTDPGDVVTTFWACLIAAKSFEDILPQSFLLVGGQTATRSLLAVLKHINKAKTQTLKVDGLSPQFCEGEIEMQGVSFAYPSRPGKLVLQDCCFSFPAGHTTFVVGRSGSGKSTVGNLLMRFYSARSGTITVDGNDISDVDTTWLRNNITLVQQTCTLFNETIFTNIALGSQDPGRITHRQIEPCLKLAALEQLVVQLPHGLYTRVGVNGSALSGGQTQRVALARARLRDAPILVLDEATSALDAQNRSTVMEAVRTWRRNKTTIIITHDLTQIHDEDMVYMMDAGRIIRRGRFSTIKHTPNNTRSISPCDNARVQACEPQRFTDGVIQGDSDCGGLASSSSLPKLDSKGVEVIPSSKLDLMLPPALQPDISSIGSRLMKGLSLGTGAALQNLKRQSLSRARAMYSLKPSQPDVDHLQTYPREFHNVRDQTRILPAIDPAISLDKKPLPVPPLMVELQDRTLGSRPSDNNEALKSDERSAQPSVPRILATLWPVLNTTERAKLAFGFLAALIHAGSPPAFSYALVQLFGTFSLDSGYHKQAVTYSLTVLGVAVADGLACFLMQYLLESVSQVWVNTLRTDAAKRILQQPKGWFDRERNRPSVLISSLDRNAEEMRILLDHFAAQVLVVVAMMTVGIVWSFATCWKMTLVSLAAAPFLFAVTKTFDVVSSRWTSRTNSARAEISGVFVETFSDIRTIRALTLESYFHGKYSRAVKAAFSIGTRRAIYSGVCFGLSESAIMLFTPMIFWYGRHLARGRECSVKDILTVFALLLFCTASASAIVAYIPQVSSATDNATRLLELARMSVISHEYGGKVKLDRDDPNTLSGPIHFINQTFFYPTRSETAALRQLNLTIPSGKCTAIVGSSGSGKSTITSLILGLYPPATDELSIPLSNDLDGPPSLTLSGRDIRILDITTLRSLIAIVPQTPVLFSATVRENITYGLQTGTSLVSATCIESAARAAGIHEFIQSLPQGYATIIGDGGLGVSGGQGQRIVVARALIRDPKILILDEATSALDHESAGVIRDSIINLIRTKEGKMTVVVVTHAKEMMSFADHVIVLENGSVAEEGAYQELLRRRAKLWEMLEVDASPG